MASPSLSQQRALAYAQKPFAIISFLSSGYVAYHILFQRPEKRSRLYHRLVLTMNFAVVLLSSMYFYGTWAVPAGTPGYVDAAGNVQSCMAQGFIALMTTQTVHIYYCSLALQSFLAMRNNFREQSYAWIEVWIHYLAWVIPCALTIVVATTGNINPGGAGCWIAKAPRGCESDPEVPCERGEDIAWLVNAFGICQIFVCFVFPPVGAWAIVHHLRKAQRRVNARSYRNCSSRSMQLDRASAQKKVLHGVRVQISLYLLSFWLTTAPGVVGSAYELVTGSILYNLRIASLLIYSSQGFVFAAVYFLLDKIAGGDPDTRYVRGSNVVVVPENTKRRSERKPPEEVEPLTFHIFESILQEDRAWSFYFDESSSDGSNGGEEVNTEDGLAGRDTQPNDNLA